MVQIANGSHYSGDGSYIPNLVTFAHNSASFLSHLNLQVIIVSTDITTLRTLSEELQAAMTAKSRFLANMSHEVRTPLSGIVGMGQLLAESNLTSYQRECVDTIIHCGKILSTVINDVLDFSKIEANTLVLECVEMDLRTCMEVCIAGHVFYLARNFTYVLHI